MSKKPIKHFFEIGGLIYFTMHYLSVVKGMKPKVVSKKLSIYEAKRELGSKTTSWIKAQNPIDGRSPLVLADSIPEESRTRFSIPTSEEFRQGEEYLDYTSKQLLNGEKSKIETDVEFAVSEGCVRYYPTYSKEYPKFKDYKKRAQKHALIEYCLSRNAAHEAEIRREIWSLVLQYREIHGWSNERTFERNLKKADLNGIERVCITALKGKKSNNLKTHTTAKAIVETLYRDPRKYSYHQIHLATKAQCVNFGIPAPSKSWVNWYCGQPEVQNRLAEFRYGLKKYNDTVATFLPRIKPEHPGTIWQMDGTPIQFHHMNTQGKQARLYLFFVMDVCTGKIVGFSLTQSEDRFAILEALKAAVNLNGHLPAQLIFDNSSALKAEESKAVLLKLNKLGVVTQFTKVGNPQEKGNVERLVSTLQTGFQNLIDGYIGQGITSRRKDARANPDFIQKVYTSGLPNEAEMKFRIIELIDFYNITGTEKNPKPTEHYRLKDKPHVKPVDSIQYSLLFWNEKTVKVSRSMIRFTIKKQEQLFEIYDHEHKNSLNGRSVKVKYDEADLSVIHLFESESEKFICECRQQYRVRQAQVEQTDKDVLAMQAQAAKKLSHRIHNHKKSEEILKAGGMDEATKIISPYSLHKSEALENENSELKELLAIQSGIDFKQVGEYTPINTVPNFIHKKQRSIERAANDKVFSVGPALTPFKPEEEREDE